MDEVEKAQAEFVLWLSFRGGKWKAISNIHIQTKQKLFLFLNLAVSRHFTFEGDETMFEELNVLFVGVLARKFDEDFYDV